MARRSGTRIELVRHIAGLIEKNLESEGISQRDWASRIGLSQPTVSRLLSAEQTSLVGADLERLAAGLRRPVAELILVREPPAPGDSQRRGFDELGPWDVSVADLERWTEKLSARERLHELVWRLICATVPWRDLVDSRFLLGHDAQRKGWDGSLECATGGPHVPAGRSLWELSVRADLRRKAKDDVSQAIEKLAARAMPAAAVTLVVVTPRDWGAGSEDAEAWAESERSRGRFRDVRVIDGPKLLAWARMAPAVRSWLSREAGRIPQGSGFETVEEYTTRWGRERLDYAGDEHALPLGALAAGRAEVVAELLEAWARPGCRRVCLQGETPEEAEAFAVHVAASHPTLRHRAVIVTAPEALQSLATFPERLVLIDGTAEHRLALPPGTPHVLVRPLRWDRPEASVGPEALDRATIHLRYLAPARLAAILGAEGWAPDLIQRVCRAAEWGFVALRALFTHLPPWAEPEVLARVWPSLVLGRWPVKGHPPDEDLLRLAGDHPEEVLSTVERLALRADSPLERRGAAYVWKTPIDTWRQTERIWLPANLERLVDWAASTDAVEAARVLALVRWSKVAGPGAKSGAEEAAGEMIERALSAPEGVAVPPVETLAEVAPRTFLKSLPHAPWQRRRLSVLWALERLSWAPELFGEVVGTLLRLQANDIPEEGLKNSPLSTLHGVLLTRWFGSPTGGLACREALEGAAARDVPGQSLVSILLRLLPRPSGSMWMGLSRPEFLECRKSLPSEGAGSRGSMTSEDLEWMVNTLLAHVVGATQWRSLIEALSPLLGTTLVERCLAALEAIALPWQGESRRQVRAALRKHGHDARAFRSSWWAFKGPVVEAFERVYATLATPDDELELADIAWMYESHPQHPDGLGIRDFPADGGGYAAWQGECRRRAEAELGRVIDSMTRRGAQVTFDWPDSGVWSAASLGHSMGGNADWRAYAEGWIWALPASAPADALRRGFLGALDVPARRQALERLLSVGNTGVAAPLIGLLPCDADTLAWLERQPDALQEAYWREGANDAWGPDPAVTSRALKALIDRGLGWKVLTTLPWHDDLTALGDQSRWIRAALESLAAPGDTLRVDRPTLERVLAVLEASGTPEETLVALEESLFERLWDYAALPAHIRRALETSPVYAAAIVRATYRAEGESPESDGEQPGMPPRARIGLAVELGRGALFLPSALGPWADELLSLCAVSGHVNGAHQLLGHVLGNLEADRDDPSVWPPRIVCEILQRHDSPSLRSAIGRAHFNRQGVREIDPHDPARLERDLAELLHASATRLGNRWPETARLCEEMEQKYRRAAEWEIARR